MAQSFNLTAQLNLRGPNNVSRIVSSINRQLRNINANVNLNINQNTQRAINNVNATLITLNTTLATTTTNSNNASAAINNLTQALTGITNLNTNQQLTNAANATQQLGAQANRAAGGGGAGGGGVQQLRTEMEEFGRVTGLALRRFAGFSLVAGVIGGLTRAFDQGFRSFIDFNQEFVKLQQVTGESANGLGKLEKTITGLATNLGVGSNELAKISSTLAQAGLSAKDTEKALEALALSSLAPSFDNMNDTVEGSIALMRQFDISAGDLKSSLGSVNAVAAAFAVESKDIISAIQRTGGVFASASKGVSEGKQALNEFIAVFTSVRQTTRESAETIATGLRTIFTRIQRGDTIEALKEYGVNLTDLDGKFVGAYKAVELLSKGLNTIDPRDLKFSQIVEELGGFRQIGKVIPLIQQFGVAQKALGVAQAGETSLTEDAIIAQQSLANQFAKVREEFLAMIREIGGTDTFKNIVTGALSLASALIKVADSVKGVLPVVAIITAMRGASALRQFGTGFLGGLRGGRGAANGGLINFANGGAVPVALMPGETVLSPQVTKKIGLSKLKKLNHADKKMAKGGGVGLVPGSGNTDSFYTSLPEGSFVIRKAATKALGGPAGVIAASKYEIGGPVDIKKLSNRSDSGAKIRLFMDKSNNFIENSDTVKAELNREKLSTYKKPEEKDKEFFENIKKQIELDAGGKQIFPVKKEERKRFDALSGPAIETILANRLNAQKYQGKSPYSDVSNAPIDLVGGRDIYEVKFKSGKTSNNELLAKLLRYKLENNFISFNRAGKPNNKDFRENKLNEEDNIDLGKLTLISAENTKTSGEKVLGYKSLFINWLKEKGYYQYNLGGKIQKFVDGGLNDPKETLEKYYYGKFDNPSLANTKQLSKEQRQVLAKDVKNLRKLRTEAPETLYSSISRIAFDTMSKQVGLNKNPNIPPGTDSYDKEKYYNEEVKKIIGKSFQLPGFVSTSKNFSKAKLFLDNAPRNEAPDNWAAMMTIKTKPKAKGVDVVNQLKDRKLSATIQDINPRTRKMETFYQKPPEEEEEFILSPKSKFRVEKANFINLSDYYKNLWMNVQQYEKGGYALSDNKMMSSVLFDRQKNNDILEFDSMTKGLDSNDKKKKLNLDKLGSLLGLSQTKPFNQNKIKSKDQKNISIKLGKGDVAEVDPSLFLQYGQIGVLAQEKSKKEKLGLQESLRKTAAEQLLGLGREAGIKDLGIKIPSNLTKRLRTNLIENGTLEIKPVSDILNKALAIKGTTDAAEEARIASLKKVAIAGMFPFNKNKNFTKWKLEDGQGLNVFVRGFDSSLLDEVKEMRKRNLKTTRNFAAQVQNKKALGPLAAGSKGKVFGPFQPLALDFDDTLALGTKMLDQNGVEDLSFYSDRTKVSESLKKARPTSLAKRLAKIETNNPGYIRAYTRILTARPQSTADLIASTLNRFGLPYAVQDITGVSKGIGTDIAKAKVANLAQAERIIDDNKKTINAAKEAGFSAFQYKEVGKLSGKAQEKLGRSNIEGAMLEAATALAIDYGINFEQMDRTRSIDFPNGLGRAAQLFNDLPPNIPTDIKRTLNGDSFTSAKEQFNRYFKENPQAYALGGLVRRFADGGEAQKESITRDYRQYKISDVQKAIAEVTGKSVSANAAKTMFMERITPSDGGFSYYRYLNRSVLPSEEGAIQLPKWFSYYTPAPQTSSALGLDIDANTARTQKLKRMYPRRRADGGLINSFAEGGSIPALVSNGEAYVPPKLAKKIGYSTLSKMNHADKNGMGRFSNGGISVFKGPGTGTSDSIPASLPVGSFIIREKATKALGLNKGGAVQKLAGGGLSSTTSIGFSLRSIADYLLNGMTRLFTRSQPSRNQTPAQIQIVPPVNSFSTMTGTLGAQAQTTNANYVNNQQQAINQVAAMSNSQNNSNINPQREGLFSRLRGGAGLGLSLAIPMITDLLTSNEPTSASQAGTKSAVSTAATGIGSATAMLSIGGPLGIIGAFATGLTTAVNAVDNYSKAVRQFNIETAQKRIEDSGEKIGKVLEEISKKGSSTPEQLTALNEALKTSVNATLEASQNMGPKASLLQFFTESAFAAFGQGETSNPQNVSTRAAIFEKQGFLGLLQAMRGGPDQEQQMYRELIPALSREASKAFAATAQQARSVFEESFKSGKSVDELINAPEWKQQSEVLARSNAAIQQQIMLIEANNSLMPDEKKARIDSIIATEAETQVRKQAAEVKLAEDLKKLQKEINQVSFSFNRMLGNMDIAIQSSVTKLSKLDESLDLTSSSLSGQAKIGTSSGLQSIIDVLKNPRGYNSQQQQVAFGRASSMFGSQSGNIEKVLKAGSNIESTVLGTINRTLGANKGTTNEAITGKIESAIRQQLKDLELPPALADKLSEQIGKSVGKIRKEGEDTVDYSKLLEDVPELSKTIEIFKNTADQATKAIEFNKTAFDKLAEATNKRIDIELEANARTRNAQNILAKGSMDLQRAFGKNISLSQRRTAIESPIRSMTGGTVNPSEISANYRSLESRRIELQSSRNKAEASRDVGAIKLFDNALKQTSISLRENIEALKNMADNSELASAALEEIDKAQKKQQAGVSVIEKLVTSTPQDLASMSQAFSRLEANMQGIAIAGTSPEQRRQSLDVFQMIAPFLGDQEKGLQANVLQSMLQESGLGVTPLMQQILDGMRNPQADPQQAEAIRVYNEAISRQSEANSQLAVLNTDLANNIGKQVELGVTAALKNTSIQFERKQLDDFLARINIVPTQPAQGKAKGGLIYKAVGGTIFQPKGTDTVPAMLTPGEFVVNKNATRANLPLLKSINNGYSKGGDVKYYQRGGIVSNINTNKSTDPDINRTPDISNDPLPVYNPLLFPSSEKSILSAFPAVSTQVWSNEGLVTGLDTYLSELRKTKGSKSYWASKDVTNAGDIDKYNNNIIAVGGPDMAQSPINFDAGRSTVLGYAPQIQYGLKRTGFGQRYMLPVISEIKESPINKIAGKVEGSINAIKKEDIPFSLNAITKLINSDLPIIKFNKLTKNKKNANINDYHKESLDNINEFSPYGNVESQLSILRKISQGNYFDNLSNSLGSLDFVETVPQMNFNKPIKNIKDLYITAAKKETFDPNTSLQDKYVSAILSDRDNNSFILPPLSGNVLHPFAFDTNYPDAIGFKSTNRANGAPTKISDKSLLNKEISENIKNKINAYKAKIQESINLLENYKTFESISEKTKQLSGVENLLDKIYEANLSELFVSVPSSELDDDWQKKTTNGSLAIFTNDLNRVWDKKIQSASKGPDKNLYEKTKIYNLNDQAKLEITKNNTTKHFPWIGDSALAQQFSEIWLKPQQIEQQKNYKSSFIVDKEPNIEKFILNNIGMDEIIPGGNAKIKPSVSLLYKNIDIPKISKNTGYNIDNDKLTGIIIASGSMETDSLNPFGNDSVSQLTSGKGVIFAESLQDIKDSLTKAYTDYFKGDINSTIESFKLAVKVPKQLWMSDIDANNAWAVENDSITNPWFAKLSADYFKNKQFTGSGGSAEVVGSSSKINIGNKLKTSKDLINKVISPKIGTLRAFGYGLYPLRAEGQIAEYSKGLQLLAKSFGNKIVVPGKDVNPIFANIWGRVTAVSQVMDLLSKNDTSGLERKLGLSEAVFGLSSDSLITKVEKYAEFLGKQGIISTGADISKLDTAIDDKQKITTGKEELSIQDIFKRIQDSAIDQETGDIKVQTATRPRTLRDLGKKILNPYTVFANETDRVSLMDYLYSQIKKSDGTGDYFTSAWNTLKSYFALQDRALNANDNNQLDTILSDKGFDQYRLANSALLAFTDGEFGQLPDQNKIRQLWSFRKEQIGLRESEQKQAEQGIEPQARAKGGLIYASSGTLVNYQPRGTDTVPAMLTPGEFVINKKATQQHLPLLKAINSGSISSKNNISGMSKGGIVYLEEGSSKPVLASSISDDAEQQRLFEELEIKRLRYKNSMIDPFSPEERQLWTDLYRQRELQQTPSTTDKNRRIALSGIPKNERTDQQQEEYLRLQYQNEQYVRSLPSDDPTRLKRKKFMTEPDESYASFKGRSNPSAKQETPQEMVTQAETPASPAVEAKTEAAARAAESTAAPSVTTTTNTTDIVPSATKIKTEAQTTSAAKQADQTGVPTQIPTEAPGVVPAIKQEQYWKMNDEVAFQLASGKDPSEIKTTDTGGNIKTLKEILKQEAIKAAELKFGDSEAQMSEQEKDNKWQWIRNSIQKHETKYILEANKTVDDIQSGKREKDKAVTILRERELGIFPENMTFKNTTVGGEDLATVDLKDKKGLKKLLDGIQTQAAKQAETDPRLQQVQNYREASRQFRNQLKITESQIEINEKDLAKMQAEEIKSGLMVNLGRGIDQFWRGARVLGGADESVLKDQQQQYKEKLAAKIEQDRKTLKTYESADKFRPSSYEIEGLKNRSPTYDKSYGEIAKEQEKSYNYAAEATTTAAITAATIPIGGGTATLGRAILGGAAEGALTEAAIAGTRSYMGTEDRSLLQIAKDAGIGAATGAGGAGFFHGAISAKAGRRAYNAVGEAGSYGAEQVQQKGGALADIVFDRKAKAEAKAAIRKENVETLVGINQKSPWPETSSSLAEMNVAAASKPKVATADAAPTKPANPAAGAKPQAGPTTASITTILPPAQTIVPPAAKKPIPNPKPSVYDDAYWNSLSRDRQMHIMVDQYGAKYKGMTREQSEIITGTTNVLDAQAAAKFRAEEAGLTRIKSPTEMVANAVQQSETGTLSSIQDSIQLGGPKKSKSGPGAPTAYAQGGIVYANNGQLIQALPRGTDTVPAMLTPGEFVINRAATRQHLPLLRAINGGGLATSEFNRGGLVQYAQNGGIISSQYLSNGGSPTNNISSIPSSIRIDSSGVESSIISAFQTATNSLQNVAKSFGLDNNQLNAISGFANSLRTVADALANINITPVVKFEMAPVQVNITGANGLTQAAESIVNNAINNWFTNFIEKNRANGTELTPPSQMGTTVV